MGPVWFDPAGLMRRMRIGSVSGHGATGRVTACGATAKAEGVEKDREEGPVVRVRAALVRRRGSPGMRSAGLAATYSPAS